MFSPAYSEFTILFKGQADIDGAGRVKHDEDCPCEDSGISTQIECGCEYDDIRDLYNTYDCNPLKQLKVALDVVMKEHSSRIVDRESKLFENPPEINPETLLDLVVSAMRQFTLK